MDRWALAMVAVVLLFVPTAAAELSATVVAPEGRIAVEIGSGRVGLNVTMDCTTAWLVGPPPVVSVIPLKVTFAMPEGVEGITVTGPGNLLMPNCATPAATSTSQSAEYQVRFTRQAPGLQKVALQIHVEGPRAREGVYADQDAYANVTVEGDYYPYIQGNVPDRSLEGSPGSSLRFAVTVSNFGNAATDVTFVRMGEPLPEGWNVTVPPPVALARNGTASNSTVEVVVGLPDDEGWNNRELPLTFELRPTASLDSSRSGPAITITVLARVRGVGDGDGSVGSPAAGPLFVLALLACALAARRIRAAT